MLRRGARQIMRRIAAVSHHEWLKIEAFLSTLACVIIALYRSSGRQAHSSGRIIRHLYRWLRRLIGNEILHFMAASNPVEARAAKAILLRQADE